MAANQRDEDSLRKSLIGLFACDVRATIRKIITPRADICGVVECTLKKIEESDLVFFACSATRLTRNQLQIAFGGTSTPKEQVQWNREQ